MKKIRVLGVADPAIYAYLDTQKCFLHSFEHENGIRVDFEVVEWSQYCSILEESYESYHYDIIMLPGHLWRKRLVDKKVILPLPDDMFQEADLVDILPNIRQEMKENGKFYLVPSFCDGHIIVFRKSVFPNLNQEVISINDLMKLVKTQQNSEQKEFVLKADESEIFLDSLPYLRSEDVEVFDSKGNLKFYNDKGIRGLDKYIQMKSYCSKDVRQYGNVEVTEAIKNNKCDIGITWSGQLGKVLLNSCVDPEDLGFICVENGWNTTWSFAINKLTQDYEASLLFLKFISSREIDEFIGETCGCPTRQSNFNKGKRVFPWYKTVETMIHNAKPLSPAINVGDQIGTVTKYIIRAFDGEISSKEALRNAYNEIVQEVINEKNYK